MKSCLRRLPVLSGALACLALCLLTSCSHSSSNSRGHGLFSIFSRRAVSDQSPQQQRIVVSVEEQHMVTFEDTTPRKKYPVSTSRFGLGDKLHSCCTPLGRLEVVDIIGQGLPKGALLRGRQPTGEILRPNTPGHDAIVTRIIRLRGREPRNARAMQRCIYIHGTTAEKCLRTPVSWGCVRMASRDIIRLCQWVKPGARVDILAGKLPPPEMLPP